MHVLFLTFVCVIIQTLASNNEISGDIVEIIKRLEESDREHKREILSLTRRMIEMESENDKFQQEITQLKKKLEDAGCAPTNSDHEDEMAREEPPKPTKTGTERHDLKAEGRSVKAREALDTEVAFYATHSLHDMLHLGQDQIIVFNQTVTNIGNAYNTHHGTFVAPVDGTYVFHVTLMGRVHNATSRYYLAYLDVDDVPYSVFWIIPWEQSSHMLVIELKSGSVVSVKNGHLDDGVVGQHYSAFSGFLLYQHFRSPALVGK